MSGKYMLLFAPLIFTALLETGCDLKTLGRQQPAGSQTEGHFKFKDESGGNGTTEDGNRFSFHVYTSQDGVALSTYIEEYPTLELANRAMDEKAKEASSIIARGPRLDRNSEYLGERVVLTVEKKTQGEVESESFICWTTGSRLHWIQSKSLKHALAFEKTLYP
jgi:hypothetical protein